MSSSTSADASPVIVTPLRLGLGSWSAAELFEQYPPQLRDKRKQLLLELAVAAGPPRGAIEATRWRAPALEAPIAITAPTIALAAGAFDYAPADAGAQAWWLNFADAHLFGFYGGPLLAQDELQVAEHPILASVREAFDDASSAAIQPYTRDADGATPVLVRGAERRIAIDLAPGPGRPRGLYGNHFAATAPDAIRAGVTALVPAPAHNILAIAAPSPGHGIYARATIVDALTTATGGFAAARVLSHGDGLRAIVHTGAWGTGAFGGNKVLMAAVQLIAARLARLDGLVFHAIGAESIAAFEEAVTIATTIVPPGATVADPLAIVDALIAHGFRWGVSDGN